MDELSVISKSINILPRSTSDHLIDPKRIVIAVIRRMVDLSVSKCCMTDEPGTAQQPLIQHVR